MPDGGEERIALLERQLKESQSVARIGSWELDLESGLLTWTDQIYTMFGLTPGQFPATYEAFLNAVHPDDRDAVNRAYTRSVEERTEYSMVHRLLRPDGSIKHVHERGRTIYNDQGKPMRSMGTVQDISDLHATEMALRQANNRLREEVDDQGAFLRHITDSLPDELFVIDDSGRVLFTNRIPVAAQGETIGSSFFRQVPERHLPALKACVVRALATGDQGEVELKYEPGELRSGDFLLRVTRIPQSTHRLLVLITDITARKAAEEGARRHDALRRAVEKLAMVASWEYNPGRGCLVSPDLTQILHAAAPITDIEQITRFLQESDSVLLTQSLDALKNRGVSFDREVATNSQSRKLFLRVTGASEGGRIFGYVQDITERKSSELMILSWFSELRALQRALEQSAIVSVTDTTGIIMDVNDHFCKNSGYSRNDLIGRPHSILNSGYHSREFWAEMWETIKAGSNWRAEVRNRTLDGRIYWVDTVINPIHNEHGEIVKFLSIGNLITDRKKAESALIHAREEAERASLEKSNFLARMSHEIRTPMNGIIGLSSILLGTPLAEAEMTRVRGIHQSASNLLRIINDILDYSRIEAGKIELVYSSFSPRDILSDVVQMLPQKEGVEVKIEVEPDVPEYLKHDPVRVRQVLINLAGNAVKFTARGSVQIRASLLKQNEEGVTLEFSVKDTGIGIPPADLSRLFKPYVQGDLTRQRRFEGTGLGLAISAELVSIMGGELKGESEPGNGARFWFTLPCMLSESAPRQGSAAGADGTLAAQIPLQILVVDDNHLNRIVAVAYLSAFGYNASSVESGAEAVELSRKTRFDLIFMDVHMPDMDGIETAERILRQNPWPEVPRIVALTADVLAGNGVMDGCLLKPINLGELEQTLRDVGRRIAEKKPALDR